MPQATFQVPLVITRSINVRVITVFMLFLLVSQVFLLFPPLQGKAELAFLFFLPTQSYLFT
ncbi:hypothetical protein K435DRAFT_782753 [Dendrothele bispora CBS 962.96]|uniref:Uncharacterized protein n=1 Tax=Dendrothele bispora (strain CBS 962.96) TaxID=1314807 RepID=A0A4V4HDC1_DENBC|nr:hypothetical protein K435DRAFT_782753 [Dendrothele bispora CBS 962.96]